MAVVNRRHRKPRKWVKMVLDTCIIVIGAVCLIALFLGAVLQESYKLNPVIRNEISERN